MYLSLIGRKIKTTSAIFKILTFLNQDFSNLKFDILLLIFRFIFVELFNFQIRFLNKEAVKVFQKKEICCEQFSL